METETQRTREFRNRPGRDLLIALAVCYAALAISALFITPNVAVLLSALLVLILAPVGLLLAIMKTDLNAALGLALIIALAVVFFVRMPGFLRVPILVLIFVGAYYCTLQAGTVIK